MDVRNPDTWKQQWTAFTGTPYIVAPLIVFAAFVGWWLKERATITGLKGRISVFENRLKLAAKQAQSVRVIAHVPLSVVTLGWGAGYLRG